MLPDQSWFHSFNNRFQIFLITSTLGASAACEPQASGTTTDLQPASRRASTWARAPRIGRNRESSASSPMKASPPEGSLRSAPAAAKRLLCRSHRDRQSQEDAKRPQPPGERRDPGSGSRVGSGEVPGHPKRPRTRRQQQSARSICGLDHNTGWGMRAAPGIGRQCMWARGPFCHWLG